MLRPTFGETPLVLFRFVTGDFVFAVSGTSNRLS